MRACLCAPVRACARVCVRACARVPVRLCVRACARVCVRTCVHVCACACVRATCARMRSACARVAFQNCNCKRCHILSRAYFFVRPIAFVKLPLYYCFKRCTLQRTEHTKGKDNERQDKGYCRNGRLYICIYCRGFFPYFLFYIGNAFEITQNNKRKEDI